MACCPISNVLHSPTSTPPNTLAAPVLISPANNASLSNYPRTMNLSWQPVAGANYYQVEVQYYDESNNKWETDATGSVFTTSDSEPFISMGSGRWRVTAADSSGVLSAPSEWRYFEYTV